MVCLEDLKVGLSELKEQLETLEEPGYCQTGKVVRNQKLFVFSGKERMRCTSPAWRGGIHN